MPVVATPPEQPATPVVGGGQLVDELARDVRHRALQCAMQYSQWLDGVTPELFWHYVAVFERYIRTGERGAA